MRTYNRPNLLNVMLFTDRCMCVFIMDKYKWSLNQEETKAAAIASSRISDILWDVRMPALIRSMRRDAIYSNENVRICR